MPTLAIVLVLVAALIHALWNFVAKKSGGDIRFALLTNIALCIIWAPVGAWFIVRDAFDFGPLQWGLVAASGAITWCTTRRCCAAIGSAICQWCIRSRAAPVRCSRRSRQPRSSAKRWAWLVGRVLAIVGGIVVIAGGAALLRGLRKGTHSAEELARLRAGVGYGVLTGAFIAGYTLVDGYAVEHAGVSPVLVDYLSNLIRLPLTVLLILLLSRRDGLPVLGDTKRMWRPALVIGLLSPVAYVLVLFAMQLAPLSQVAPAREVSMLFAAFLGGSQLGERDVRARLFGAACIAAGVVAIACA